MGGEAESRAPTDPKTSGPVACFPGTRSYHLGPDGAPRIETRPHASSGTERPSARIEPLTEPPQAHCLGIQGRTARAMGCGNLAQINVASSGPPGSPAPWPVRCASRPRPSVRAVYILEEQPDGCLSHGHGKGAPRVAASRGNTARGRLRAPIRGAGPLPLQPVTDR